MPEKEPLAVAAEIFGRYYMLTRPLTEAEIRENVENVKRKDRNGTLDDLGWAIRIDLMRECPSLYSEAS